MANLKNSFVSSHNLLGNSSASSTVGRRNTSLKKAGSKLLGMLLLLWVVGAEAQTFQYSRGWTNGKRGGIPVGVYGGASSVLGPYDLEANGILGSDPLEVILPPGHLQMNLNPRLRSGEFGQYLVKRSATLGDKRKPLWYGVVAEDHASQAAATSKTSQNARTSADF